MFRMYIKKMKSEAKAASCDVESVFLLLLLVSFYTVESGFMKPVLTQKRVNLLKLLLKYI